MEKEGNHSPQKLQRSQGRAVISSSDLSVVISSANRFRLSK